MTRTSEDCAFLEDIVDPDRVSFEETYLDHHDRDASPHPPSRPDAVVWPTSSEEIAEILSAANERDIPVTPWCGGSGLEGNAIPVEGGIVCNTYNMANITVVPEDLQATVGAGVVYNDLNEQLERWGLQFPPGISSGDVATIGGMIATNASGFNSVRYGETRDNVRRLEVVLPDGRIVECGRNVMKTSSGYSLKDLIIGSEGTLGVVTEATLSLTGLPEHQRSAIVTFPTPDDASKAVAEIIQYGLNPGALEFLDSFSVEVLNSYNNDVAFKEGPTLIIELHANNTGIDEDVEFAQSICMENNALNWRDPGDFSFDEVWEARRDVYPAIRAYKDGLKPVLVGDVVVPISKYPRIIERIKALSDEIGLMCPCVGHAGDGNIHYNPLVDRNDSEMVSRAEQLNARIIEATLDLGGTITGEHGIGLGKRQYMEPEHGVGLDIMEELKATLDPNGIMNPGKIFPANRG